MDRREMGLSPSLLSPQALIDGLRLRMLPRDRRLRTQVTPTPARAQPTVGLQPAAAPVPHESDTCECSRPLKADSRPRAGALCLQHSWLARSSTLRWVFHGLLPPLFVRRCAAAAPLCRTENPSRDDSRGWLGRSMAARALVTSRPSCARSDGALPAAP